MHWNDVFGPLGQNVRQQPRWLQPKPHLRAPAPSAAPSPSPEYLSVGLRVQDKLKRCSCSLSTWVVRELGSLNNNLDVERRPGGLRGLQVAPPHYSIAPSLACDSVLELGEACSSVYRSKLDNSWSPVDIAFFPFYPPSPLWRLLHRLPGTRLESLNYPRSN